MRFFTPTACLLLAALASGQNPPDARDALLQPGAEAGSRRRLGDGEHAAPHRHRDRARSAPERRQRDRRLRHRGLPPKRRGLPPGQSLRRDGGSLLRRGERQLHRLRVLFGAAARGPLRRGRSVPGGHRRQGGGPGEPWPTASGRWSGRSTWSRPSRRPTKGCWSPPSCTRTTTTVGRRATSSSRTMRRGRITCRTAIWSRWATSGRCRRWRRRSGGIASGGADYLYTGAWGQKFVEKSREKGYCVSLEDMGGVRGALVGPGPLHLPRLRGSQRVPAEEGRGSRSATT